MIRLLSVKVVCVCVCVCFVPSAASECLASTPTSIYPSHHFLCNSPPCFVMTSSMNCAAQFNEPLLTSLGWPHVQRPEAPLSDTRGALKALLVAPVVGWNSLQPVLFLLLFKMFQSIRTYVCLFVSVHDLRMLEI